jgi:hypothetical protein
MISEGTRGHGNIRELGKEDAATLERDRGMRNPGLRLIILVTEKNTIHMILNEILDPDLAPGIITIGKRGIEVLEGIESEGVDKYRIYC